MSFRNKIAIIFIIFLLTNSTFAFSYEKSNFTNVNKLMNRLTEEGFSGAVLVAQNGKISSNGYGYADREKKIKNTPNTVFSTGSVTKPFTGAAILKLEMNGKLSVNDKLSKYFKDVPDDKKEITIHHLLTHSSGFPGAIGSDSEIINKRAYLKRAFETPLKSKPGAVYRYSNVGYSLLAAIIEEVSDQSYPYYVREKLFVPAKMFNTGYNVKTWKEDQISVGYKDNNRWGKMTEKYQRQPQMYWNLMGNGGILSTVEDLYKWHLALESNTILDKKAKAKHYAKHIKENENGDSFYGYGWSIVPTSKDKNLITHNGGNGIFFTDFWRFPDEDTVIILMTNGLKREFYRLAEEINETLRNPKYVSGLTTKVDAVYKSINEHPNNKLINSFIETYTSQDKKIIENFINKNFSKNLVKMVSMKGHIESLSQIGDELKGLKPKSLTVKNGRTTIGFENSPLNLILIINNNKIAGIGIND